jgi:hypothetical protein
MMQSSNQYTTTQKTARRPLMAKKSSMRDKAKKKAEKNMNRTGGGYLNTPEGAEFIKVKGKGPYNWDIIPYKVNVSNHPEVGKGEEWYQRTIFVHYNIGSDNKAFICPKTIGKPCPICEYVKELFNSDEEENIELAKQIKAKERELYNIIDLDDQEKGVQLFEYSYHLFGKALDEEVNEGDDDLAGFAELEGGKTLEVHFRKKKLGKNEFYEVRKIDFEDREEYEKDILEDAYDLDSLLKVQGYDFLQKALFDAPLEEEEDKEDDKEDDDDGDEPKKPSKKKSDKKADKKTAKKPKKSKDDDDDDDGKDNDDNDDKSSKKSSKKKPEKKSEKKSSKKSSKKKSENECPHGGTFGEDTDELDECEDCDMWTECQEKYEELHEEE